jgi:starch phosphorylase
MDVRRFFIKPQIPEKLAALEVIAENMWAYWDKDAERLFHRLDPQLFRKLNHNSVELLYRINADRLKEAAKDKGFLYELKRVFEKFKNYMSYEGTYMSRSEERPFSKDDLVMYSCMEYGLHESLPFYSGGLAVLAGDQLKGSSDVGIPMVSFGLLYAHGYFNQRIGSDGMQIEEMNDCNWHLTPIREVTREDGSPMFVDVPLKNQVIHAKLWNIQVGRTQLYLLDTNIHQNPEKIRKITGTLYDADRSMRIEQEILLGRGSIIALKALNISPKIYHINEGHTAFSILERLIALKEKGLSLEEAKLVVKSTTVFTTHTPVVEGNENFPDDLVKEYFQDDVKTLGITMNEFLSYGKIKQDRTFWLPAFAMRFSRNSNGVSKIHAQVSRGMWRDLYPTLHEREMPIDSVTNGVHIQSWLSLQVTELFDRYIGPDYFHKADLPEVWKGIYDIPDGEIWNAHCRRKEQIISFIRNRVSSMMQRKGYAENKVRDVEQVLNPNYLTLGFARRFAPYKRANLVLSDPERFAAILTNKQRPVQIVFAGKAHPADLEGKRIIKEIFNFIDRYPVEHNVVFIEDYDINIARHLVQGVDVWLNTPTRPMEASGTSGMKAAMNGVLNLSIMDGWWPEAYDGENGWAISAGEHLSDPDSIRKAEANQLYELLENDVTELFYERRESSFPAEWVQMMKKSMAAVCSRFNMHRAMREYLYKFYLPQMSLCEQITQGGNQLLHKVLAHKNTMDAIWSKIYLKDYFTSIDGKMPVSGEVVNVDGYVYLDDIDPDLVRVEIFYCYGPEQNDYRSVPLSFVEKYQDKVAKCTGNVILEGNGMQEVGVRVVPSDEDFRMLYPEYIKWRT